MSFVSHRYMYRENDIRYIINDSEFGEVEIDIGYYDGGLSTAVAKAYRGLNLPVGKNVALAHIYWAKKINCEIGHIVCMPGVLSLTEKSEMDEYLVKLLPLL